MTLNSARRAALIIVPCLLWGQSRFADGEFKGFTKSPTEHIINRHEGLVHVRLFEGRVVDPTGAPIPGAIVEVRGPGTSGEVTGKSTDKQGRFRFGEISKGKYTFKITFNGFQSVVGQLVIDPYTNVSAPVNITLKIGV